MPLFDVSISDDLEIIGKDVFVLGHFLNYCFRVLGVSGLIRRRFLHKLMKLFDFALTDLGLVRLADHLRVGARHFILLLS